MRKRASTDEDEAEHLRALNGRALWAQNRALALSLDHETCRLCSFNVCVEVHHILPRSEGGSDAISNLITLCPNHHAMAHRNLIQRDQFAKAVSRRKGAGRKLMSDGGEIIEHVGRAFAAVDSNDPRELTRVRMQLAIELPEMLKVAYGAKLVSASLDSFRELLLDAF